MTAVLDHLAIGTSALADGWDLFGGVLGGRWAYGSDSAGFWVGPVGFAPRPENEMLAPRGHGTVIRVARQGGPAPLSAPPPRDLPEPGPATRLDLIEQHVGDLDA